MQMKTSEKLWSKYYKEIRELGKGGNGRVIFVEALSNGNQYALKYLLRNDKEKVERFKTEIKIINAHFRTVIGLIPIIDYNLDELWYVMEYAKPVMSEIQDTIISLNEIVKGILELCDTLEALHAQYNKPKKWTNNS